MPKKQPSMKKDEKVLFQLFEMIERMRHVTAEAADQSFESMFAPKRHDIEMARNMYKVMKGTENTESDKKVERLLDKLAFNVVIIGEAGIGKSALTQMLLTEIRTNGVLNDRKFIFHICVADIDFTKPVTLINFITIGMTGNWDQNSSWTSSVLDNFGEGNELLIILDGLDECNTDAFSKPGPVPQSVGRQFPDVHIKNLMLGNVWPKARKAITCRQREFYEMAEEYRPSYVVYVTGLTKMSQHGVCKHVCRDSGMEDIIWDFLETNPHIQKFCILPMLCQIIVETIQGCVVNRRVDLNLLGKTKISPLLQQVAVNPRLYVTSGDEDLSGKS